LAVAGVCRTGLANPIRERISAEGDLPVIERARFGTVVFLLLLLAACATPRVDLTEPRRMLGTESDVRLDAEIRTDTLTPSQQVTFNYSVTNNRSTPIAMAELIPEASYDPDTRVVTVTIGTEVPGEEFLPRVLMIPPGQRKDFSGAAHVNIAVGGGPSNPFVAKPNGIQLKLNFLGDPGPFEKLIGIPERAVHDPGLAAALFPKWVEGNETLFTNVLPMHWSANGSQDPLDASNAGTAVARRRGRP
jgi:hypothetical protein